MEQVNTMFLIVFAMFVLALTIILLNLLFAPVPGQLDFIKGLLGFFSPGS